MARVGARAVKIGLGVVAGVLIVVAALLVVVIGALHTDWGRERIRERAERELAPLVRGELSIGSISGSPLGRLTLRDVVIRDRDGEVVIAVERIMADYLPLALLRRQLYLGRVEIEAPSVWANVDEEGRLNLTELFELPEPDPETEPWTIHLNELELTRGELELTVEDTEALSLANVRLQAGASIVPSDDETQVEIDEFSADLSLPDPEAEIPIAASGSVEVQGDEVSGRDLALRAGLSSIEVDELTGDATGQFWGDVAVDLRAADLDEVLADSPWIGDVRLEGSVARDDAEAPIAVTMSGAAAGAPTRLSAAIRPDLPRVDVNLTASEIDPSAAVRDAPPGSLEATVNASMRGGDVPGPAATADISASGRLAGRRLDSAELSAVLEDDSITADGRLQVPGASARGDAVIALGGEEPALAGGAIRFNITDAAALTEGEPDWDIDVQGRAEGTLSVSGPFDALAVQGTVRGEELRYDTTAIRSLTAHVALAQVPDAPTGRAVVSASGITIGDERVSQAEARIDLEEGGRLLDVDLEAGASDEPYGGRARARVDLRGDAIRADVSSLAVRTRHLVWRAEDTAIAITEEGHIDIANLELWSAAGRLSARGTVRGEEAGNLDLRIVDLDLGSVREAVAPDAPPVGGVVNLVADAAWDPARGKLSGTVDDLTLPALPTIDLDIDAALQRQRVTASLRALGADDQRVDVQLDARAPEPIHDLDAWKSLGVRAIERLVVETSQLRVADVSELLGDDGPRRGTVELSADLGPGLASGEFDATIRDLGFGDPWPEISASLSAEIEDRLLRARARARTADGQRLRADIAGRLPEDVFDPSAYAELSPEAVESIAVELDGISLPSLAHALDMPIPERGVLTFSADLGAALEQGSITAEIADLDYRGVPVIAAEIDGDIDGRAVALATQIEAERVGSADITIDALLPAGRYRERIDVETLGDLGPEIIEAAAATATLDLGALTRIVPEAPPLAGEIAVQAEADAALASGRLRASGANLQAGALERALATTIDASFDRDETRLAMEAALEPRAGQKSGPRLLSGELTIEAGSPALLAGEFDRLLRAPARGQLLGRAPLAFIGRAAEFGVPLSGVVRGKLEVRGSLDEPALTAWLDAPGIALAGVEFDELRGIARVSDGRARGRLRARQASGRLDLDAAIPLDEPSAGTITASARNFDLGFLAAILQPSPAPVLDVGGRLSAELRARPSPGQPEIEGYVRVEDGRLDLVDLRPIRNATLDVRKTADRADLELTARSDRGRVAVTGRVGFDGLAPTELTANVRADEFPVPAVPQVPLTLGLDAHIGGTKLPTELWRFDVRADRVLVDLPEPDQYRRELGPVGELEDVRLGAEDDEPEEFVPREERAPVAVIRLHTPNDVIVRGEDVDARIETDLRVTMLRTGVSIEGNATVARGRLRLFDRRYDIDRARVAFEGNVPPSPRVDVRLSHQFATVTLFIDATGPIDEPQIRFASEPAIYDPAQLLAFVLGGSPDTGAEPEQQPGFEQRAAGAASALIAEQVGDVLRRAFPIDVLRIGTEDPAEDGIGFVTVGKWLREDLFVAYRRRIDPDERENLHEARLEYQLFRNWTLEGVAGADQGSVDLLWIHRY